jgi:hypothetical protein
MSLKIIALTSLAALVTLSGCAAESELSPSKNEGTSSASDAPFIPVNCGFDAQAQEVPAEEFFALLQEEYQSRRESPFNYTSSAGEVARFGAFNYWLAENTAEFMSLTTPEPFDTVRYDQWDIQWQQFVTLQTALCNHRDGEGNLKPVRLALDDIFRDESRWPGHSADWPTFAYVETGREVIPANSPEGLEHYTQYITGGGVMIVAGDDVAPEALLSAHDAVEYMTSARPEFRAIFRDYHVRISLFIETTSTLPEFQGTDEPGGFAMGMNDAAMTANAEWLCYPGNNVPGGNPVIHELAHTMEHIVFEHENNTDFFARIVPLALAAIDEGSYGNYEQNLPEGTEQDTSHLVGEYWAQVVEGYIMDGGPRFKYSHWSRDWIKTNDPEVFDLLVEYLPTEEWDYVDAHCEG